MPRISIIFCITGIFALHSGCDKSRFERPNEAFYFEGYATDCVTGKPVPGAVINVVARHATFVVDPKDDVGSVLTGIDGYYKLYPTTTSVFSGDYRDFYNVTCRFGSGLKSTSIHNDSVRKGNPSFRFDFSLVQPATLDISLYNSRHNASDTVVIDAVTTGCSSGYAVYFSAPFQASGLYTQSAWGDLQGETARASKVIGGQPIVLKYTIKRTGRPREERAETITCPANDTTRVQLEY